MEWSLSTGQDPPNVADILHSEPHIAPRIPLETRLSLVEVTRVFSGAEPLKDTVVSPTGTAPPEVTDVVKSAHRVSPSPAPRVDTTGRFFT